MLGNFSRLTIISNVQIRNKSFLAHLNKERNVELNCTLTRGGQQKQEMLASLGLRLSQHCQLLTLDFFGLNRKIPSKLNNKLSKNVHL